MINNNKEEQITSIKNEARPAKPLEQEKKLKVAPDTNKG